MKRISSQISLALIGLFFVGFMLLLLIVDFTLKNNLQTQLIDQMKIECLLIDDLLQADSLEAAILRIAHVTKGRLTVLDEKGNILADSEEKKFKVAAENHLNRDEIQQAIGAIDGFGSSIRHSKSIDEDLIYTAYKSPKGRFIRLSQMQEFEENIILKVRLIFLSAALASIILVLLLIPRVSKHITQPLSDIIAAAEEIKAGNYDKEIVAREPNEIGELARILNEMSAKLKGDIQKLNHLQEVRKDFVANASHELRTPISSIRGYVETLLDGALEDEAVGRKFLERALTNVIRLETIVNDMLDLSKLESRDKGLSLRYFDPLAVVNNLIGEFEETAHKKNLKLFSKNELPADFKLFADWYQFEKALINLVENAIKYTEKGQVCIRMTVHDKNFVLSVEDTGPGINPDDLSRIFERFYRVDKGRSRQQGGSGLGLSIVKHVMDIHKGSVHVESEPGKGTRFILTFPATPAHEIIGPMAKIG